MTTNEIRERLEELHRKGNELTPVRDRMAHYNDFRWLAWKNWPAISAALKAAEPQEEKQ